jgi:hypothetical protein
MGTFLYRLILDGLALFACGARAVVVRWYRWNILSLSVPWRVTPADREDAAGEACEVAEWNLAHAIEQTTVTRTAYISAWRKFRFAVRINQVYGIIGDVCVEVRALLLLCVFERKYSEVL